MATIVSVKPKVSTVYCILYCGSVASTGRCCGVCVQVSYAIGVAEPLSVFISSYGTGIKSDADLLKIVKANFDLRPGKIVKYARLSLSCLFSALTLFVGWPTGWLSGL